MSASRSDLNPKVRHPPYLLLSLVFSLLSAGLAYVYLNLTLLQPDQPESQPEITEIQTGAEISPEPELEPEDSSPSADTLPTASASASPIPKAPTKAPSVAPTAKPTTAPGVSASPTPATQTYTSNDHKFTVTYSSSRKIYQDSEGKGTRYTLYHASGNIAIHVGPDWSWVYPNRNFTADYPIDSQPSFRYEIADQTIVDVTKNSLNYTLQCVHGGSQTIKTECDTVFKSFRFL